MTMSRLSIFLPLLAVSALASDVEKALLSDDQCVNAGDGDCVLNALQVKSLKSWESDFSAIAEEADEELQNELDDALQAEVDEDLLNEMDELLEDEEDEDLEWLKDISVKTKNTFKKHLKPLQKPIVAEYQALEVLAKFANYTMEKVENATGTAVIWNAKTSTSLLEEEEDEELEAELSRYGRRRRSSRSLPPRARYIDRLLIYLEKEMKAVWNLHTMVDRKRWGIGNTITSMPYGPHGEHPNMWKPNGSFPMPLFTPPVTVSNTTAQLVKHVKAHSAKYKNKYAEQLQQDYESLVANIKDAEAKTKDLQKALLKMDNNTEKFRASESGVFKRITIQ